MMSWHRWAAASAVLLLAPALACGGGDDGAPGGAGETSEPHTTSGPAPQGPLSLDELATWSGGAPAVAVADPADPPARPDGEPPVARVGEAAVSVTAPDGTVRACCVLVAASSQQRQQGLMRVTDLGGYTGMLFMWDGDNEGGFWMRNTPMPLSIAWFEADGDFVSAADMVPCGDSDACPTYDPSGPYRFALEVPQGGLAALGAVPGSRLTVGGPCA
ncbi:MAG TPA: DUF192 domain-containing protein [Acidimicrobiales bacterium]|nr:DUF192 domain-containing protein [Acidimicrobiales bacterium]